ncbi:stage II sporulation protein M [Paenibacillus sp. sptzw28]|uniref:stage II sporulation protein M n=1 Tax=Paenibacillus sp. sptzw28 TaxID=715179 RepID=UPI001C6EB602|nr:stage II sporulation protein M [Paenibacillus sp. sptzw28]QYR23008.1 stage II sporulation protein M [Paenibacillus sp. sptzw28]
MKPVMLREALAYGWTVFRSLILAAFILYALGAVAGAIVGAGTPIEQLERSDPGLLSRNPATYIVHNTQSIAYFIGGMVTFGLSSLFALLFNGFLIGYLLIGLMKHIPVIPALLHVIPHGLFEVPAMLLAGAVGLYPLRAIIRYTKAKEKFVFDWKPILGCTAASLLLLWVAGMIEAWFTPIVVMALSS